MNTIGYRPNVNVSGRTEVLNTLIGAGNDRVCVNLGYQGTERLIEPYGLKVSKDGNVLVQAYKRGPVDEPRSYRLDRIEHVSATNVAFRTAKIMSWGCVAAIAGAPVAAALAAAE